MKVSITTKIIGLIAAILFIAIGLVTYRSISFFVQDKETYVYDLMSQVMAVQSQELDRKFVSLRRMMEIFDEVSHYALNTSDRTQLLNKYNDFSLIASYRLSGGRLVDHLVIANRAALSSIGYEASQVAMNRFIAEASRSEKEFSIVNMTNNPSAPLIGLVLKIPNSDRVVVGLMLQMKILDLSGQERVYETMLVDSNGTVVMHHDPSQLVSRTTYDDHPMVLAWKKDPSLALTREYKLNDNTTMLASFSSVQSKSLGLFITIPKEQALLAARRLIGTSGEWAVAIFIIACLFGVLFSYTLTRPIKLLAQLTKKVAKGDFAVKANVDSNDEIGELVDSFNHMSEELDIREKQLEESHQKLVQSEKMSAFGQMSAGIAHEVKNPLAGILGYAQLSQRKLEEDSPVKKYMEMIEKETRRCKDIIDNLMRFARQEKQEFHSLDVNAVVRDAVALVDHQISIAGVKIERNYAEDGTLPSVMGNANQIQQVLMNLMLNAQHAMSGDDATNIGTLTVSTKIAEDNPNLVQIVIQDTGHGIDPENVKKIFEPFFTTKPAGQGTGLGLAVSYGIIKDHQGDIIVDSVVGEGTAFTICLPSEKTATE